MKTKFNTAIAAVAAATLLLATGCMTEAELRAERISNNVQAFSYLDQATQARVQQGYIQLGDSSSAAWFAFGDPGTKSSQIVSNGVYEVWNYFRSVPEYYDELVPPDPPPPPPRPSPDGRVPPPPPPQRGWHYEQRTRYVEQLSRQLMFSNDQCVGIFEY